MRSSIMADATLSNDGVRARQRSPRRGPPPPLHCRTALFLDIDGTLLDLALTPDLVRVDGDIAELLPALARCFGGALALITGRTIADADRLFPGLALPVAGQHGVERRAADGAMIQNRRPSHELVRLRGNLGRFAARHEGVILEDKGATLALHYRQAPHLASLVHRTLRAEMAVAAHSRAWRLQSGKGIVEIRPDGRDKGTAIGEYMDEPPFLGRLPVFVGDDDTDEFGFAAVSRYDGWAVKVGPGPTGARYRLKDVIAVRRWLAAALVPAASVA
jgi:trehalose 6-phosphate phosphatase